MTASISVCIPTYNGARYLRQCLQSAVEQTYGDVEILVLDDGSIDETVGIAKEFERADRRIRLEVNQKNLGLVGNWNRCVDLARGEWIKFLFQDDFLQPDCVENMLKEARPDVDLIACRRQFIFEDGTPEAVTRLYADHLDTHALSRHFPNRSFVPAKEFAELMAHAPCYNCIGEPTMVLVRRSAFDRFGYFSAELVSLCDWEFFARVAANSGIAVIDQRLATFRVHGRSESAKVRTLESFRGDYIDKVIINYLLLYSPHFTPVRAAAVASSDSVDLRQQLLWRVAEARREAYRMVAAAAHPDSRAIAQWRAFLKRYPKLRYLPLSYGAHWGMAWLKSALSDASARRIRL